MSSLLVCFEAKIIYCRAFPGVLLFVWDSAPIRLSEASSTYSNKQTIVATNATLHPPFYLSILFFLNFYHLLRIYLFYLKFTLSLMKTLVP